MSWSIILEYLKWLWGPLSGFGIFVVAQHFWPTYNKWSELKEKISTAYTQYGNLRPKFHYEEETKSYGKSPTGQEIVGPTYQYEVMDNQPHMDNAIQSLRQLAGNIRAIRDSTLGYSLLVKLFHLVPDEKCIAEVSKNLILWSNLIDVYRVDEKSLDKCRTNLKKLLNLSGD